MERISCEEFDAFESVIDTDYFGIASAKVILKKACQSGQEQSQLLCFLRNFEFNVITNKANDPFNNRWLGEKTSAFLTDINVQLTRKVSAPEKLSGYPVVVTDCFPEDSRILQLAENSFHQSRFLNDPYLPGEKARLIYADIVKNAFGKTGRFFVSLDLERSAAGFILFSINALASSSTIELIAVDPGFQGRGIGKSLIQHMEKFVGLRGVARIIVGTQLANLNALGFYTSYGFSSFECSSIYHYWPAKP